MNICLKCNSTYIIHVSTQDTEYYSCEDCGYVHHVDPIISQGTSSYGSVSLEQEKEKDNE